MAKRYRATTKTWILLAVMLLVIAVVIFLISFGVGSGDEPLVDGVPGGTTDSAITDGTQGEGTADGAGDTGVPQNTPEETAQNLARLSDTVANPTEYLPSPYIPEGGDELVQLVNKIYGVDQNYTPANLQLTKYRATDRAESNQYMVDYAADAMDAMIEGAMAEGYTILVTTAYRSYSFQSVLYNNYVTKDGQAAADRYSARPGTSEHQTGLAADLTSPSVNYALTSKLGETDEGKWLADHAHDYGFILRFPQEGEPITGYMYEAWHFRYVGIETATYIWENNLTLEEYIAQTYHI